MCNQCPFLFRHVSLCTVLSLLRATPPCVPSHVLLHLAQDLDGDLHVSNDFTSDQFESMSLSVHLFLPHSILAEDVRHVGGVQHPPPNDLALLCPQFQGIVRSSCKA